MDKDNWISVSTELPKDRENVQVTYIGCMLKDIQMVLMHSRNMDGTSSPKRKLIHCFKRLLRNKLIVF